jgi:hypothetical protein
MATQRPRPCVTAEERQTFSSPPHCAQAARGQGAACRSEPSLVPSVDGPAPRVLFKRAQDSAEHRRQLQSPRPLAASGKLQGLSRSSPWSTLSPRRQDGVCKLRGPHVRVHGTNGAKSCGSTIRRPRRPHANGCGRCCGVAPVRLSSRAPRSWPLGTGRLRRPWRPQPSSFVRRTLRPLQCSSRPSTVCGGRPQRSTASAGDSSPPHV